ncbi:MAG: ECF transporter S component [Clostridiales bacterium]|jgi:uncharacterized membrane protein|nr:ECF transporter S component [Clostridiales bacterium]
MNAATKKIAYAAVLTAMTAVMTTFSIGLPGGGYIHLGDAVIFLACLILPTGYAVFSAGAGSMIADLILAPQYAVATLIIKAVMALIVCLLFKSGIKPLNDLKPVVKTAVIFLIASLVMQVLYFVYELFLNDFVVAGGVWHVLTGLLQTVFSVPLGVLTAKYSDKIKL